MAGVNTARSSVSALSERDFQRQVTDLADILGWKWAHFRPAQTSRGWRTPVSGSLGEGWVDLTLIRRRDRRLIFAELKSDKGALSVHQAEILDLLREFEAPRSAGATWPPRIQVVVWRPSDIDAIAEILS